MFTAVFCEQFIKKEIEILVKIFLPCVAKHRCIEPNGKITERKCTSQQMNNLNFRILYSISALTVKLHIYFSY